MRGRDRVKRTHFAKGNQEETREGERERERERERKREKEREKGKRGKREEEMESQREIGGMSSSPLMQRAKLTRTSFLTRVTSRLCEPRRVYQREKRTRGYERSFLPTTRQHVEGGRCRCGMCFTNSRCKINPTLIYMVKMFRDRFSDFFLSNLVKIIF